MSELGCYLKYDNSSSEYDECLDLEYVYYMWENGYCSKTYIIKPAYVYYEDASFNGITLNHLKTAKRIKQRKFKAVQNMIANCRQELDFFGMTGERIMSPVFKPGDYYYAYVEDIEEGIVEDHWSHFYRIISVENNCVTYQYHILSINYLVCETSIYTEKLEHLIYKCDTRCIRWYKINENLHNIVARKIAFITEEILDKFRK